jgi:hypothetical protein
MPTDVPARPPVETQALAPETLFVALGDVATHTNVLVVSLDQDVAREAELAGQHGIKQGIPPQVEYLVPNDPHIFDADVTALDSKGQATMGRMKVLMAHGFVQDGGTGTWTFKDGRVIEDVVNAYNADATLKKLPLIEMLAVCRNNPSERAPHAEYYSKLNGDVLHVIGSDMALSTVIDPSTGVPEITARPVSPEGRIMSLKRNMVLQQQSASSQPSA